MFLKKTLTGTAALTLKLQSFPFRLPSKVMLPPQAPAVLSSRTATKYLLGAEMAES